MLLDTLFYLGLFSALVILCIFSYQAKDIGFIINQPFDFFMEMLFVSIIPALLMVFVFARTRKFTPQEATVWFWTVLFKLMIFHLLFQLSGFYTYVFGNR